MTDAGLQTLVEQAFEDRAAIAPATARVAPGKAEAPLKLRDSCNARIAAKILGRIG